MKKEARVEWFDEIKGIGEGKTTSGETIFLNYKNILPTSSFITLKAGEVVHCETQLTNGKYFASLIEKVTSPQPAIEKSTFLEPMPLESVE